MRVSENHTSSFGSAVLFIILTSSLLFFAFMTGFFPSSSLAIVPGIYSSPSSNSHHQGKPPYSPPPVNASDSAEISEAQALYSPSPFNNSGSTEIASEAQVSYSLPPVNYSDSIEIMPEAQAPYSPPSPVNTSDSIDTSETQVWSGSGGKKLDAELKKHKGTEKVMSGSTDYEKDKKLKMIEARLAQVRYSIREASRVRNLTSIHHDPDYVPQGPVYRNPNAFHRSYLWMEKVFKIFVYEEGDPPLFHDGPCKNIYSSEGRFIHELARGNYYRTHDPLEASVYFLPFSVVMMVENIYRLSGNMRSIGPPVRDYVHTISHKYPFWNRSLGFDHFMLSCHDWGPIASSFVPQLYHNSIRVLCNANTSEGFNPTKDVSLPEINLITGEITGLLGGYSPSRRNILAFFAGRLHGHIRSLLLQQWKDKDHDLQVYEELPKGVSYHNMLRSSRFCLCPSGYEVASPRIVEAIFAECVPVLISDSYVPPFSDVLNWKAFSVKVDVKDIGNLKKILMEIPQRQYLRMQRRVKIVQRHFVPNDPPKRFDVFHMITHSVWLRRLNVQVQHHTSN